MDQEGAGREVHDSIVEEKRRRTGEQAALRGRGKAGCPAGRGREDGHPAVQRREEGQADIISDTRRRHPPCIRV